MDTTKTPAWNASHLEKRLMQSCVQSLEPVAPLGKAPNFYQPKSLFLAATEFIVHHLPYVDSFLTLPDIVGEEIFKVALHTKQFVRAGDCTKGLQLFTTAYKAKVLESLTITKRRPVLDDYYLELKLFLHLRELDISSCSISDSHSFLVHAGSQLCQLKKLLLGDNCLTDKGIQTLTACSRMMGYGLKNLTFLDLSGNTGISEKVAVYMKCFNQLSTLNLSNCNISESGKESIASKLHLTPCELPMSKPLYDDVINKGWATPLIDSWCSLSSDSYLLKKPSKSAEKFYSRKRVSPRKSEKTALTCKHLLFLRHNHPQPKLSLSKFDPVKSGTKDNLVTECNREISKARFDTTKAGIITGCKSQTSPYPLEPQRRRTKHLLEYSENKLRDERLSEFYNRGKLCKESTDFGLDSSQIRVVECKRQVNPFVRKVLRKESEHTSAVCRDKSSILSTSDFGCLPSNEIKIRKTVRETDLSNRKSGTDLTACNMSENSISLTLNENSHPNSMMKQSLAHSEGKAPEVVSEVKHVRAGYIREYSQGHSDNSQVKRGQITNLRRKKRKMKILKENHQLGLEFSETIDENSPCKKAMKSNHLPDLQVRRTFLAFLE